MLYSQRPPGGHISGSEPRRRIHSSGSGISDGLGGPIPMPASCAARTMGGSSGRYSWPNPIRNVSRSRSVMARSAGTVSSSGPSIRASTRLSASSGSSSSSGSPSRSRHCSTSAIAAAAAMGLVIELMRNRLSRLNAGPPNATEPSTSTCTSPWRSTSVITPGTSPRST